MQAISNQIFTVIVSCDSIIDFFSNSYFIVQIYHAKSFKKKHIRPLYLNFLLRTVVRGNFNIHGTKNFQYAVFHHKSKI